MKDWRERAAQVKGVVLDVDGVLTDGRLHYGRDGESMKTYYARDGLGLVLLREAGIRLGIVSGRESPMVTTRAEELRISPCLLARTSKSEALDEVLEAWNLTDHEIAVVGDDLIDVPMLRRAGVSFAPADADPRVLARVDVQLRASGGRGAVREACEHLLHAIGAWPAVEERFGLGEAS